MDKVKEIVIKARQTGSTTWILKAAINNPNCIIVTGDIFTAKELKDHYFKLINKQNWLKRLWRKIFNRKHPVFCSVDYNRFDNADKPIIFDNSSL